MLTSRRRLKLILNGSDEYAAMRLDSRGGDNDRYYTTGSVFSGASRVRFVNFQLSLQTERTTRTTNLFDDEPRNDYSLPITIDISDHATKLAL